MSMHEEEKTIMLGDEPGEEAPLSVTQSSGSAPRAKLICVDDALLDPSQKGLEILLDEDTGKEGEQILGRGEENSAPIRYRKVSRKHARIAPVNNRWQIEDLNSTNGVWINEARISTAVLKQGDYVKIGVIPFRFMLERPDLDVEENLSEAPPQSDGDEDDDDAAEKTMLFGDVRAADALLDAEDARAEEEKREKAKPKSTPKKRDASETTSSVDVNAGTDGGGKGKLVALFMVFALAGGGGYWYWSTADQRVMAEVLRDHQRALKHFISEYETATGHFSQEALQEEMVEIDKLEEALQPALEQYPDNRPLRDLAAQWLFFRVERQLKNLIESEQVLEKGDALIQSMRRKMADLKTTSTMTDLVALAADVVAFKKFRERFPSLSDQGSEKPSGADLEAMQKIREHFVSIKKDPGVNTSLGATFPYFRRIVSKTDQYDLPLLDRWKENAKH